eukprot:TRINITY_DN22466_c0_g1_i1.p1 TRINITY_DN22466_c0_g1~~TRINITY_DN22466_c0_g1_i1.p1  ORF type:complete len:1025 (+),score=397.62 TRINITY_DN22466_c0_g1_i1:81-3155(+)
MLAQKRLAREAGFGGDPAAAARTLRWAEKAFPEAARSKREEVFGRDELEDEDPACYALLCAEEGRMCPMPVGHVREKRATPPRAPIPSLSIEPSEPRSRPQPPTGGKVETLDGVLTAGPAPSAPSPVPPKTIGGTPMTGRTEVESASGLGMPGFNPMTLFRDSVASQATLASSAASPAPKPPAGAGFTATGMPMPLMPAVDFANATPQELEEAIAFMQFQSQMEQVMGNEGARDEAAVLAMLQQQSEQDFLALAGNRPTVQFEDILLSRPDTSQPPGFELDENMRVVEIMEDSPALFSGLMGCIGYRLIEVNGVAVHSSEDLQQFWSQNELMLRLVSPEFDEALNEAEATAAAADGDAATGAAPPLRGAGIMLSPAALSETAPSYMMDRAEMSSPTQAIPPPPTHSPPTPPDNNKAMEKEQLEEIRKAAGVPLPPAVKPALVIDDEEEPGYVFIRGFGDKISRIKRILDAAAGNYKAFKALPETVDANGAAVVVFGSNEEAEVASQSLHQQAIGRDEVLEAFMVWEARGEPNPKDIIEKVDGRNINLTAVVGKTPAARPRELQRWDEMMGKAPSAEEGLGDGTVGEWDQFAANKKLGFAGTSFDDDIYSTKLDANKLTEEQRRKAEAMARSMGESNRDSMLAPDGEGDGDDEEARHSAVLRKPAGPTDVGTKHLLITGLNDDVWNKEVLTDFCGSYEGGAEAVWTLKGEALSGATREKLKALDKEVKHQAGLLKFMTVVGAADMISELHGMAYDESQPDARICLTKVYPEHPNDTEVLFSCEGVNYVLNAPALKTRELQKWTAGGDHLGELGTGTIGEWDQFEANKKLGIAESTYCEELYTTALHPLTDQQKADASRLATEIGQSNKDSLLCADGEGDGDDEEARHSCVNPSIKAAGGAATAAAVEPPAAPGPATFVPAETCYVFLRGTADMGEEDTRAVLEAFGCPARNVFVLPEYRHPVGAVLVEIEKKYVREALALDKLELEGGQLVARLVFPVKVYDPERLVEELPNGVMLDLTFADERQ